MDSAFGLSDTFVSIAVGVFLCIVYDIFRVLLFGKRGIRLREFFADVLFCIIAAVVFTLLQFNLTSGKMRAYPFMLAAAGFAACRLTVGAAFRKLALKIKKTVSETVIKLKIKAQRRFYRIYSDIYTKRYCRLSIKKAKCGFSALRKGIKNEHNVKKAQ